MADKELAALAERLRGFALGLPDAYEDFPWGDRVAKVGKKIFVFLGQADPVEGRLGLSVKLPESAEMALTMPTATPTGYGLGRAGWVSLSLTSAEDVPGDLLCDWIEESYRAIAPKRLIARLDADR